MQKKAGAHPICTFQPIFNKWAILLTQNTNILSIGTQLKILKPNKYG